MSTPPEPLDSPAAMPAHAGAWRRLGAFLIDVFILGLAGAGLGFLFFDSLAALGGWGRLLGFATALGYFGIFNSRIGNGQTPGKRALHVRVVGIDGSTLPPAKSLLRFIPLGLPWFLNNAQLPPELTLKSPSVNLLAMVIFGLALASLYLFFFNRPSRRVVHDFVAGSQVVAADAAGIPPVRPLGPGHLGALAVIFISMALVPSFLRRVFATETLAPLIRANQVANAEPGVIHAQVSRGWSSSEGVRTTYLHVVALIGDPDVDDGDRATRIARAVLQADPSATLLDAVHVTLVYGYDLGIATGKRLHTFSKAPGAWVRTP
jgi:uncharacterized RDD family membrane protein YckC